MDFTSKEIASLGIAAVLQSGMIAIFFTGLGLIIWRHYGGLIGVTQIIASALGFVIGQERGQQAAEAIDSAANVAGEWVAEKTLRASLPPVGPVRNVVVLTLCKETFKDHKNGKKILEHIEEIRKLDTLEPLSGGSR
jgi:hypothetical protein